MKRLLILVSLLMATPAWAQSPVFTLPYDVNSVNASSTVTSTNTFQSIFAAVAIPQRRASCTIQNNSVAGRTMFVFFGPIASATTPSAVQLSAGQSVTCSVNGSGLQDQVSITGTSGDQFFAAQQ